MLTAIVVALPLLAALVTLVALYHSRRTKHARRAAYLAEYPSVGHLLAVLDRDNYREIRDRHGRSGAAYAARAVQRDYPGISLAEVAEVVSTL